MRAKPAPPCVDRAGTGSDATMIWGCVRCRAAGGPCLQHIPADGWAISHRQTCYVPASALVLNFLRESPARCSSRIACWRLTTFLRQCWRLALRVRRSAAPQHRAQSGRAAGDWPPCARWGLGFQRLLLMVPVALGRGASGRCDHGSDSVAGTVSSLCADSAESSPEREASRPAPR